MFSDRNMRFLSKTSKRMLLVTIFKDFKEL